jgi:integral membrane protein
VSDQARALLRYRIAAYLVGTLLLLACLSWLLYGLGEPSFQWIWIAHGWFYIVYLILAFDLHRRVRWPLLRLFEMLVAGLLPGLTFVIERDINRFAHRQNPSLQTN